MSASERGSPPHVLNAVMADDNLLQVTQVVLLLWIALLCLTLKQDMLRYQLRDQALKLKKCSPLLLNQWYLWGQHFVSVRVNS